MEASQVTVEAPLQDVAAESASDLGTTLTSSESAGPDEIDADASPSTSQDDPVSVSASASVELQSRDDPSTLDANGASADQVEPVLHAAGCSCSACQGDRSSSDQSDGAGDPLSSASLGTLDQLADYLETQFWTDSSTVERKFNLTNTGSYANNGELTYNTSGNSQDANGLTSGRAVLVDEAFKIFEATLGIDFQETDAMGADFRFGDDDSGAYAYTRRDGSTTRYAGINVASGWYGGSTTFGDYAFQTVLHEIGHGLGLGHQGLYNGSGDYATDADFTNDSWQASMMSYFSQTENTSIDASFAFLSTPMVVDWIALDDLYGSQGYGIDQAFLGDTTYGFNTNIEASTSKVFNQFKDWIPTTAYALVDGSGDDTLDLSGFSSDQLIDLRPSGKSLSNVYASNIAGKTGNLSIAPGTLIESAIGGSGADTFRGNSADNSFEGGDGSDTLLVDGSVGDYRLLIEGSGLKLIDLRSGSPDGTDIINGVELVEFNGTSKDWDALLALVDTAAPSITGPSGSAGDSNSAVSINENSTAVATFAADESVVWSLSGGVDQALFVINSGSGALSFSSAPDYEAPGDSSSNNQYVVQVRATDLSSNSSDQILTVQVLDVDEPVVSSSGGGGGSAGGGGGGAAPSGGGGGGGGGGGAALPPPSSVTVSETDAEKPEVATKPSTPSFVPPPVVPRAAVPSAASQFQAGFDALTGVGANPQTVKEVGRLYTAAFGRSPEVGGWFHWYEQIELGAMDLLTAAQLFIQSDEFASLYGENPSNADYVQSLYTNVLGRSPDSGGLQYWAGLMDSSQLSNVDVLLNFSNSGENIALTESYLAAS